MKRIYIFLQMSCLGLLLLFSSCETTDLDITEDPNALGTGQASTDLFINSIQRDFGRLIAEIEDEASEAARILPFNDGTYQGAFGGFTNFDTQWQDAYQGILQDIRAMTPLAINPDEDIDQAYHVAMAQVIEAYVITALVDLFGDIPYREALDAENNLNPEATPGADIYADAMALLDAAIVSFKRDNIDSEPVVDLFYGGNWKNWVKAANSIKLKLIVTTRLAGGSASEFNSIISSGEYITKSSEDFQFPWGNSVNNPDSRHPRYTISYTPSGVASGYMSLWLMDYMYNDKRNNGNPLFEGADPRMRYYFYRQADAISTNPNDIMCITEGDAPNAGGDPIFCSIASNGAGGNGDLDRGPDIGYWGRAHGNNRGGPPDTQRRTTYGVYPVGGLFDDNSFKIIASVSLGGRGAGITPIMLASWVDFMRAEMALEGGNAAAAGGFVTAGAAKSIAKVRTFGSLDPSADLSKAPEAGDDAFYVKELGELYAGLPDDDARMDMIGNEWFVAMFGNGLDAYNFYRRTGRPSTLQRHFLGSQGNFFRSFLYPSFYVERNSTQSQKANVEEPVFWDPMVTLLAN